MSRMRMMDAVLESWVWMMPPLSILARSFDAWDDVRPDIEHIKDAAHQAHEEVVS